MLKQFIISFIALFTLILGTESNAPDGFVIEKDFTLTQVASEPLLTDPVDLEFNEKGDAMVLEMPGYPFEDKQSRLLVLKDKNKDGVYDNSIVFAENLRLANSFMPYKKGVLVAAPPYLLFLHDDDENYTVEKIDTLMGGFATGNLQHNYNALTYGIDNWIYAANGGNDGKPFWWGDTTSRIELRGQDFRFNLETRQLERLGESSGGFGLGMDEYGRFFETHNLTHNAHLVFPDRYLKNKTILKEHTLENISDHEENGLARVFPIGEQEERVNHPEQSGYFSGSCGITYYGGGAFGNDYKNTVWVADVVLNLIHIDKIKPNKASFQASRLLEKKEFLASTDRAFRPVNMTVGPDGNMYIVDMYRKVIEHPEWIPDDIEKTLDINAGKNQGRIYRVAPKNASESFNFKLFNTSQDYLNALSHANQWVRNTAHRLLMEKPIDAQTETGLRQLLHSDNEFARLHALWILGYRNKLSQTDLVVGMKDASAPVRENVLKIAENYFNTEGVPVTEILKILGDNDARVRMQAALSISKLSSNSYQKYRKSILEAIASSAQLQNDDWNIAALTLAAQSEASELFNTLVSQKNSSPKLLAALALNSNDKTEKVENILIQLLKIPLTNKDKAFIVQQLYKNSGMLDGKKLEPSIRLLEDNAGLELLTELAALRHHLKLRTSQQFAEYTKKASKNVLNTALPDSTRIQYLALLDFVSYKEKSTLLFNCLKNSQPLKLQEDALRQLSKYQEVEIGRKVVSMWKDLSPQTRRYASDLLLYIETHHDALLTGLENGTINIGEMNFDLERRRTLLWWTDNENTKRRAQKLFSDAGVNNRQTAIDKMKPALSLKGNSENGQKVFSNTCGTCHKYGNIGNDVGPVLTEINRKSKATLLHDILDPNAAVDPKYVNHIIQTKDGATHIGIVANETDRSVIIQKVGGEKVTTFKKDIKSFRSLGSSLMMEGLENALSTQEMADLLEFLQKG